MGKVFESVGEMIESRGYLLKSQKERLLEDLKQVDMGTEQMEEIIDRLFYKLFGKGWEALTPEEQTQVRDAWIGG